MSLTKERKKIQRMARRLGCCPEVSPEGYLCTRDLNLPHSEHAAVLDGKVLARWPNAETA